MEKLQEYFQLQNKIAQVEQVLKDLKKMKMDMESEIVSGAIDSGLQKIEYEDKNIKCEYENEISIKGGKKDTEQRQEVLKILANCGYSDKITTETYRTIQGKTLKKILKELPEDVSQALIEKDLILIWNKPVIKITKKKGVK
jgi:hypothetical protein